MIEKTWAALLHMGVNMWSDVPPEHWGNYNPSGRKDDRKDDSFENHFDETLWREVTGKMQQAGMNMIVIDIGEALVYPSHPELAERGSWSPDRLRAELNRLRKMGLEPIPKLNFSTGHDIWLKEYSRLVSTPEYYRVCEDVIRDVWEVFDHPRLFHLGYDEEQHKAQKRFDYCVIRQGELWWKDFMWFVRKVEGLDMRPWIWSDYAWDHPEEFMQRMPRSVLQSNWYYDFAFDPAKTSKEQKHILKFYVELDKAGFDQMPCGSTWHCTVNFGRTVKFCRENISDERRKGYLMASWRFTVPKERDRLLTSIDLVKRARDGNPVL